MMRLLIPGQNFFLLSAEELIDMGITELHSSSEFKLISCDREKERYQIMPVRAYFEFKKEVEERPIWKREEYTE